MNSEEMLKHRLIADLNKLSLPVDEVELCIRPFSKSFYGRYFPKTTERNPRVFIYPYVNKFGLKFSYAKLLDTAIHEMCHHVEFNDLDFVRIKGVMHSPNFWTLYNHYMHKAHKMKMLKRRKCDVVA